MLKAYEFRIYPTKEQETIFNQTLGLCRLYWNIVVANKNENHEMLIQGYKTNLVKVSAKDTSKTCFDCGYVNPKVVVGIKKWKCPVCSKEHDRDINAAKNILKKGVTSLGIVGREPSESTNACREPKSSAKQESPNSLQVTA